MRNLTALDRLIEEAGFTLVRRTNHKIWRCPCGHTLMTTACTPQRRRGDQNARALISRILRECTSRQRSNAA